MKKNYILLFILSLFLGINISYAEIKTYDRDNLDNYGVNKDIRITDNNLDNIMDTPAVDAEQKIYDFAEILSDEEEEKLYNLSMDFLDETGMELIYLTADFYNTTDSENEVYAVDFYDYNDFGLDDDQYSGLVVFRNSYADYPFYNIYTFGEAQLYYPTERLDIILDLVYYDVRSGNYLTAFTNMASELLDYYESGIPSEMKNYTLDSNGFLVEKYRPPILFALFLAGMITAVVMGSMVSHNKMIYKEKLASNYLDYDSVVLSKKEDSFITSKTHSYSNSSSSGGGGGGGFSSSSGSSGRGHGGGSGRRG